MEYRNAGLKAWSRHSRTILLLKEGFISSFGGQEKAALRKQKHHVNKIELAIELGSVEWAGLCTAAELTRILE